MTDPDKGPHLLTLVQLLDHASKRLPPARYVWGVVALAVVVAAIKLLLGLNQVAFVALSATFVGMILFYIFAQIGKTSHPVIKWSGHALLIVTAIAYVTLILSTASFVFTCWPPVLAHLYGFAEVCKEAPYRSSVEDLRASVQIASTGNDELNATYLFRNLGMQTALVSGVYLFEVVRKKGFDDPKDNVNFCDSVKPDTLLVLNTMAPIMGRGSQVGNDDQKSSQYHPISLLVDGTAWDRGAPIPIEGGKARTVSAKFTIEPSHTKDINILVLCPMISTMDIMNLGGTAICRGLAVTVTGNARFESRSTQQFRILPHPSGVACPIATQ